MTEHESPGIDGPVSDGSDYFDITQVEDVPLDESPMMKAAGEKAEKAVLNMDHKANQRELNRAECYIETDLVKRARLLTSMDAIKFVHYKKGNPNDPENVGMRAKTDSLMNRHAVYDALFDFGSGKVPYPHYDTFRARLVDHEGQVFSTKTLRTRELVRAIDKAGMENPSDKEVADSLRSWALDHRRDSLAEFFEASIPKWDGVPRLDTLLLTLFEPRDTPINRLFSRYFWMSLYKRVTDAGAQAPIILSLIGAQDLGKSYFSVLLCRLLTGDDSVGPVKLDLGAKSYNTFLRSITGKSLIAVIGEMTGFKQGDMNRIKDFVTKTEDDLDFKFEDSIIKERQWITIMDGNGYDGLQRDDTGNRRFYPLFCFQAPDLNGQPDWFKGKKVDFSNFKHDLWQVMAESRAFLAEHGEGGYARLISETSTAVANFSVDEMAKARGVTKDDNLDNNLKRVLMGLDFIPMKANSGVRGVYVTVYSINDAFKALKYDIPYRTALGPRMTAMGGVNHKLGVGKVFIFPYDIIGEDVTKHNLNGILRHIFTYDVPDHGMTDEEIDAEVKIMREAAKSGGGF